jgi:hypothetical protein
MRVNLEPAEARRLVVLLADSMAADRAAGTGTVPGSASAAIMAENCRILDKLQSACRWGEADPVTQEIAFAAMKAARV